MGLKIRYGGEYRDITRCSIFSAGSWRAVRTIKIYDGTWRDVANFAGASFDLTTSGDFNRSTRFAFSTQTISATPTDGLAPYTYSWAVIDQTGDAGTVTIPLPSTSSTTARCTFTDIGTVGCVIRITCTDSLGTVATADLTGSFTKLEPLDRL